MSWREIRSQADADALMEAFGGFHDACLRELHLWTDHYVEPDLSMSCPGHLDTRARVLIQRQFRDPSAIELFFDEITRFNLVATPENYDSIIFTASLVVLEREIFWSPEEDWAPDLPNRDRYSYIAARQLLGGHLKTGQLWTGQNRPVREPPQARV